MPDAFSRSQHFGRTPVARKRPVTLPSGVRPVFSKMKMSCIVMMSPSIPVISEMVVTRRDPSLRRVCCTTMLDGRRDLLAHRALGQVRRAHRDHRFDTGQRVARRVGVDGRQRPVVAGVHRLQHVERLFAADLADDDAIGAHAQGVDDQLPLPDRALAFDVGRTRLEPRHVFLPQLQLGGVLDRDDALVLGDEAGQHVEQRRLAGAGAAADQAVEPSACTQAARKSSIGCGQRLQRHQVVRLAAAPRETGGSTAAGRPPRAAE